MGMSIEEAIRRIDEHNYIHQRKEPRAVHITEALDLAVNTMRKYQLMQADYENRLKADMVAVLTEIQQEIEEMANPFGTRISGCSQDGWEHGVKNCNFVIQQKINKLKENEDGNK